MVLLLVAVRARTMPVGQHKGQSLRCIFETDRQYLVWCLSQSWFRTKFENLFDIIVEMFHRCGEEMVARIIYSFPPAFFLLLFFSQKY